MFGTLWWFEFFFFFVLHLFSCLISLIQFIPFFPQKGQCRSLFEWIPNKWIPAKQVPLHYVSREIVQTHFFDFSLNFTLLESHVSAPASLRLIDSLLTKVNIFFCFSLSLVFFGFLTIPPSKTLCLYSDASLDSLSYISGDCTPLIFSGYWDSPAIPDPPPNGSWEDEESCSIDTNVVARNRACENEPTTITTAECGIEFSEESVNQLQCVNVNVSITNTQPQAITDSIAFTFVEIQVITNPFAMVRNSHGVVVGQLIGNIVTIQMSPLLSKVNISVLCLKNDTLIWRDPDYTVYDIGIPLNEEFSEFRPLRATVFPISDPSLRDFVCFSNLLVKEESLSVTLIIKEENAAGLTFLSRAEEAIIFTSAGLYTVGIVLVLLIFLVPHSGSVFMLEMQCVALLLVRAITFYLLGTQVLPADEQIVDYILVEMPSFFFIGIFLQMLITISFVSENKSVSKIQVWSCIIAAQLVVWLSFAGIVMALHFTNNSGTVACQCECRSCTSTDPSDNSRVIRISYKSVVFFMAILVSLWLIVMGKKHKFDHNIWFKGLVGISFCLILNSLAFLIYYIIDQASPYFTIALWVTELVPVIALSFLFSRESRVRAKMISNRLWSRFSTGDEHF